MRPAAGLVKLVCNKIRVRNVIPNKKRSLIAFKRIALIIQQKKVKKSSPGQGLINMDFEQLNSKKIASKLPVKTSD